MSVQRRQAHGSQYIPKHRVQWRESSNKRGYDDAWLKVATIRREMDEGLCQHCMKEGGMPMAMQALAKSTHAHPVDHIIPQHVREDWRLEVFNTQTLCPKHHKIKTDKDNKKYGSRDQKHLTASQIEARTNACETINAIDEMSYTRRAD